MKVFSALCICLLISVGSQGFLFDSNWRDSFTSFFKDLGKNFVEVGKALGDHAKNQAADFLQETVKTTGIAVANAIQPLMEPVSADGRRRRMDMDTSLPDAVAMAANKTSSAVSVKLTKLKFLLEAAKNKILGLMAKYHKGNFDVQGLKDKVDAVVDGHSVQVRSVFGDVLGQVIDYGKILVNAVRDKIDAFTGMLGLGRREDIAAELELRITAMFRGFAQSLKDTFNTITKSSVGMLANVLKKYVDVGKLPQ